MTGACDVFLRCMGGVQRLVVEGKQAGAAADAAVELLHALDRQLSRFRPTSELCRLNADPRAAVPASAILRQMVAAALDAAQATGGLVDPTLLDPLEAAGYATSRDGVAPESLQAALAAAPTRRPATPSATAAWRNVVVDDEARVIRRPPGLRLDSGGIGKGLAADLTACLLAGFDVDRYAIDCAGDLRTGGRDAWRRPFAVDVQHPLSHDIVLSTVVGAGAAATSGLDARLWRRGDGSFAHHLLDPSTGLPAWTGLVGATAFAPTAAEAEALAKGALLAGPAAAPALLERHGGVVVHDDGDVRVIEALQRARVRIPAGALAAFRGAA